MDVEICTVGGYNEVGKNCTAIKYGDEVVILDMGFFLPSLINFEEEGGHRKNLTPNGLISLGAIPDDSVIKSWRGKVKAIAATHCHLDHIGGIPYLAGKYDAPVLGTPFTTEVLKGMLKDEDIKMKNDIRVLNAGSFYEVSENIKIEFINMTHSTPHTVMIAVHTPKGVVLYGNDFKFDNHPVVGKKPDYERLKKIQKEGVIGLVVDSLYASARRKTPSEKVAREMLKDVMLGTDSSRNSIIASSFASHIARLKSMIEFGKKLDRDIYIMGRSMAKYIGAAEKVGIVNFSKDAQIFGYSRQIKKELQKLDKKRRDKAMLIVTGSQGEPGSILSRMASGQLPYRFNPEDHVIFSCKVIPAEANIENRAALEAKLHKKRTRVFTDIHVSGHCGREDLRDLINMVKPKHIIPAHGDHVKTEALGELAIEMGYKLKKDVHIVNNGNKLNLK
ncbi:MAG: RNase J family beta-CASP ribonuclease [Nanoarchaeota archaeon]|nr:RNase J family beta-CASP ribonuclease [Nanoarchaeota archaeon]MBU1444802.1 RNase J family beta-CASP ribonuclease [Nanoarchaeota archaeon]MBU2406735.1 RNase J family beta-CASP ribonuclease [Nanoarchaeota archaeon]MBU2420538.1 RNase J family beta-CASP ribonuclease [Nanoarchaeota archaeon]MBU2475624.1 RNase J family beta-CASP ribonuclease [Nanoarchaeota archaeon]